VSSNSYGVAPPSLDNRPLSDREQAQLQRLLSDPLSFPPEFKNWIIRSLEISDVALGMSNVIGLTKVLGLDLGMTGTIGILNTGCCLVFAGTGVPTDGLLCDGAAYDTTAYPNLFKAIGYAYGGAGSVFHVPNIPAPVAGTKWVIVT